VSNSTPRLLWDFSSLATGQFVSMALGFVGFALLARALDPESYGVAEYVVGLTGLAAILVEGGFGPIGARDVSRDPSLASARAAQIIGARLVLALVVVPLVGFSSGLTARPSEVAPLTWWFAGSLFFLAFKQDWLLQSFERMKYVAPAQVLKSAVFALGILTAVSGSDDLSLVGAVEFTAAFVVALYYLIAQHRLKVPLRVSLGLRQIWPLIRAGSAVSASTVVWTFMLYAPILLVTSLSGSAEAAWLGSAQRIVFSSVSFSGLYFFNLYPAITRTLSKDRIAWEQLMESSYRVIAWGSIAIALASTFVARPLIVLVYGSTFSAAAPVLSVFIWLLPVRLLSGHARWTLMAGERQEFVLLADLCGAVGLIVSGALFIKMYGAIGAAASLVAANVVAWIAADLLVARHVRQLPGPRHVLVPLAAAAASVVLARLVSGNVYIELGVSAAAYGACMRAAAGDLVGDVRRLAYAKNAPAA